MKSTAKVSAAQSTYYGVKDAIANIPEEDTNGNQIDPRQRFEIAADAQGMVLLARAGYDANEAPKGWKNVRLLKNKQARAAEEALGDMAEQMRQMQAMANMMQAQAGKALGKSGLTRTIGDIPPSRPELLGQYANLKEVRDAGKGEKGEKPFRDFVAKILIPRAEKNLDDELYEEAGNDYRNLYRKGFNSPEVLYGLARSSLGDFAFSASEKEKREAEKLYQEAVRKRPKYADAWKALGELYDDWERYDDAVNAYNRYLKAAPGAKDSKKVQRKIKSLQRKADF
jgi:tetratricopeptide (TPR) repeat protein